MANNELLNFSDLSTFALVYQSTGATLDCSHIVHCAHLCHLFMDKLAILQLGQCLHLFLYRTRLL